MRGASGVRAAAPGVHCGAAGSISGVVVTAILRRLAKHNANGDSVPSLAVPKDTSVNSTPPTRRHAVVSVADAKNRLSVARSLAL